MTRFLAGVFMTSLVYLGAYVWGPSILGRLLGRGDDTVWPDVAKQPQFRYFNGGQP